LQAELNDPDLAFRRRIVYILVATGLHALPTLMDALETQPDSVAVYVVTMVAGNGPLGSIGAERAAEAVIVALQSDSPAVRREAASRLGTMGPDRALAWDALIEATRDAETDIQWLALDALNNIATEPGRHDLQWERFRFKPPPNVTAIPVGEFVRFHNGRTGPHQVVFQPGDHDQSALDALMNGMPDNTGLTGPVVDAHGAVYTVSFADVPPGTYRFTCGRHPSEAGRVHVVPSSF